MVDVGLVIDQFRAAMRERGIDVRGDIIADGILHRAYVEGDKRRTETAWYILHADDHPNGTFGCWKRYGRQKFSWSSKEATAAWTPEQRRQWQEKIERQQLERKNADFVRHAAAAEKAEMIWSAADDAEDHHPYCKRKGVKAYGLRCGKWEIANPQTGEITLISKMALLIPIRDTRKKIWSLQAIFPNDRNALHRDKDYLKDGEKLGFFFTIGKPKDTVILVCEGYATGASLHEATGHAVVIAFDSGNLEPTASSIRQRFPDYKIVICGDNDRWTQKPIQNPGKHYAEVAAAAMGGMVAIPDFANLDTKPTDFNDLASLEGLETVRKIVDEVLARQDEADRSAPLDGESAIKAQSTVVPAAAIEGEVLLNGKHTDTSQDDDDDAPSPPPNKSDIISNAFFEILGFDHGSFFFFQKRQFQLIELQEFSEGSLIKLADPAVFWQRYFKGGKKGSFDKVAAANSLVRSAEDIGIYDPDRIRGRGAWFDDRRIVYHHGDYVDIDGKRNEIGDFKSRFIYEKQRPLPELDVPPMSDQEGANLLDLADEFRWTKPASGALLCGWIVLAPICGALRWRPHVWLTGSAGSGKSTILNDFVHPLLFEHDLFAQGNTTEAGLRQKLRTDALPILFEESEQNEEKDRMRIQHVLSLIRQSSTESSARVYKGTVGGHSMEFLIRSMFCLASIQVGIKHQADSERITILALRSKKETDQDTNAAWDALREKIRKMITEDPYIGARLVRRTLSQIEMIKKNIRVFSAEAARIFGSPREGDQYGSLLAGSWSLFCSAEATPADARMLIESYSWEEHRDSVDTDESQQALSALMGSRLRAPKGFEFTVHELAAAACGEPGQGGVIDALDANTLLRRYGMLIEDKHLLLSNCSIELREIMAKSNFSADWRGVLLRVPKADRNDNKSRTFNGVSSKCIRIPLAPLLKQPDDAVKKSWLNAEHSIEE